jgi:hypothetical protein
MVNNGGMIALDVQRQRFNRYGSMQILIAQGLESFFGTGVFINDAIHRVCNG